MSVLHKRMLNFADDPIDKSSMRLKTPFSWPAEFEMSSGLRIEAAWRNRVYLKGLDYDEDKERLAMSDVWLAFERGDEV